MAELRQYQHHWRVDGYGSGRHVGVFPTAFGAIRAAIKDAMKVFADAGLVPTPSPETDNG